MKRIITSTLFALCCIILSAENISLTLNVTPGELKNQLTEEQMNTVTDLILTGAMNDEDFYTIRDNMKKLTYLDMKEVQVDTIPVKAFYQKSSLSKVILPLTLEYIDDYAFIEVYCNIVITGQFPKRGEKVWGEWGFYPDITIDENNVYIHKIENDENNGIYSLDDKILFLICYEYNNMIFPEGLETIAEKAFDSIEYIFHINFPSTLKNIGAKAFKDIKIIFPIGTKSIEDYRGPVFICETLIPPTLGDSVFSQKLQDIMPLIVPQSSYELYKSAPQWNDFIHMYIEGDYVNITDILSTHLFISKNNNCISLSSDQNIKEINIINLSGQIVYSREINSNQWMIDKENIPKKISIIKAIFDNGESETIKWMNE